jgi:hypothetical protein
LLAGETADGVQQLSLLVRPGKIHRVNSLSAREPLVLRDSFGQTADVLPRS